MDIVAGMLLLCNMFTTFEQGSNRAFVKSVETKVHYITPSGDAFVQYNLKSHKTFIYKSEEKLYDIVNVSDLKRPNHGNCKEFKNENISTKLQKTR